MLANEFVSYAMDTLLLLFSFLRCFQGYEHTDYGAVGCYVELIRFTYVPLDRGDRS